MMEEVWTQGGTTDGWRKEGRYEGGGRESEGGRQVEKKRGRDGWTDGGGRKEPTEGGIGREGE